MPFFDSPDLNMHHAIIMAKDTTHKTANKLKKLDELIKSRDNVDFNNIVDFYRLYFIPIKKAIELREFKQWYNVLKVSYKGAQSLVLNDKKYYSTNEITRECYKVICYLKHIVCFIALHLGDHQLKNRVQKDRECYLNNYDDNRSNSSFSSKSTNSTEEYNYIKSRSSTPVRNTMSKKILIPEKAPVGNLSDEQIGKLTKKCLDLFKLSRASYIISLMIYGEEYAPNVDLLPCIATSEQIGELIKFCTIENYSPTLISKIIKYTVL